MNKLNKRFLSSLIISFSCLLTSQAFAFDQYVTVKFKKPVTKKFIQELNEMTNTTVEKALPANAYKLKIGGVANKSTLDKYSEFFLLMKNIENVSPLPKDKIADKINPYYYLNISPDGSQSGTQNAQTSSQQSPQTQTTLVPDELIVKFNQDAMPDDIENINKNLGGDVTFQQSSNSYKVKLPEYVSSDYALGFYGNNRLVESVEQNKVTKPVASNDTTTKSGLTQQSGVALALPLTGRDIKVTFKIGKEEIGMKWFNEIFGSELVEKKGYHTFILRFPSNANPKFIARALKASPLISSAEVSSD